MNRLRTHSLIGRDDFWRVRSFEPLDDFELIFIQVIFVLIVVVFARSYAALVSLELALLKACLKLNGKQNDNAELGSRNTTTSSSESSPSSVEACSSSDMAVTCEAGVDKMGLVWNNCSRYLGR